MEARIEWAKTMRQSLSPPHILNSDGTIYQDAFNPRKALIFLSSSMSCLQSSNDSNSESLEAKKCLETEDIQNTDQFVKTGASNEE